jgi:hypothetical protein
MESVENVIWIYISVVLVIGLLTYIFSRILIGNDRMVHIIVGAMMMLSIYATYRFVVPYYTSFRLELLVNKASPFFYVVMPNNTTVVQDQLKQLENVFLNQKNQYKSLRYLGELANREMLKQFQLASNRSIFVYIKSVVQFYKEIIRINPTLVLFFEFPDYFIGDVEIEEFQQAIHSSLFQNVLLAKMAVLNSASERPVKPLTFDDQKKAREILGTIYIQLADQYGKKELVETFEKTENLSLDRLKAAEIIIAFYDQMLLQGDQNAGLVEKYLLLNIINKIV